MPSASKGEIWPKRLPRPGPLGSKVSKLLEVDHAADLGGDQDEEEEDA